jgi:chorismate synthase
MGAVGSIQAIKGVEIGNAFDNCRKPGSEVHDVLTTGESGFLCRPTNRSGGIEGGITSGLPIIVRAAMKPISTLLKGMDSVNLSTGETARTIYERSDICAVPRAAVVAEAMVCYVLADELMRKLGGDSVAEMKPRFEALRSAKISEVPMNNEPWRFGYE